MTAEERMAYFQGQKRRTSANDSHERGKNRDLLYLKIKFMIAVVLFILFLSLDYTGYEVLGVKSQDIVREVTKDIKIEELKVYKNFI